MGRLWPLAIQCVVWLCTRVLHPIRSCEIVVKSGNTLTIQCIVEMCCILTHIRWRDCGQKCQRSNSSAFCNAESAFCNAESLLFHVHLICATFAQESIVSGQMYGANWSINYDSAFGHASPPQFISTRSTLDICNLDRLAWRHHFHWQEEPGDIMVKSI